MAPMVPCCWQHWQRESAAGGGIRWMEGPARAGGGFRCWPPCKAAARHLAIAGGHPARAPWTAPTAAPHHQLSALIVAAAGLLGSVRPVLTARPRRSLDRTSDCRREHRPATAVASTILLCCANGLPGQDLCWGAGAEGRVGAGLKADALLLRPIFWRSLQNLPPHGAFMSEERSRAPLIRHRRPISREREVGAQWQGW